MRPVSHRCRRAFTFAEVLAAMVFVAIVIPAAVKGLSIANRAGSVAQHKRVAMELGDSILTELVMTEDWIDGETQGDFGEDFAVYRWELMDDVWSEDEMRLLTLTVFFVSKGREHSISLSTLVPDPNIEEEEEVSDDTGR